MKLERLISPLKIVAGSSTLINQEIWCHLGHMNAILSNHLLNLKISDLEARQQGISAAELPCPQPLYDQSQHFQQWLLNLEAIIIGLTASFVQLRKQKSNSMMAMDVDDDQLHTEIRANLVLLKSTLLGYLSDTKARS
jgi:hypothetical protein